MPTFDVFVSYNSAERASVERVVDDLRARDLTPWLDQEQLVAGRPFQEGISRGLSDSACCAVFIGPADLGGWERRELEVANDLDTRHDDFRVFLVLLPGLPDGFDPAEVDPFVASRTWVDLRRGLDHQPSLRRLERAVRGLPHREVGAGPGDGANPYVGLVAFQPDDADRYFGREAEVQRAQERLKGSRILAVIGASGSGKSSLVRAGLVPELVGEGGWRPLIVRPGSEPLANLAAELCRLDAGREMAATVDALKGEPRTLAFGLKRGRAAGERILLVVDQLEEVFTLCSDERQRAALFAGIEYFAAHGEDDGAIIVTLRGDFYPRCAAYPGFAQLVSAHQLLVGPMSRASLREAIVTPARLAGLVIEDGLVERILDDVGDEPGALPLMQYALFRLAESGASERRMTLGDYGAIGGVRGALAERADAVYASLSDAQRALADEVLVRLTRLGEGTEDTRRRMRLSDLPRPTEAEPIVRLLADERLVSTDRDGDDSSLEVAHEALIRSWPHLRRLLDADREGHRIRQRIEEDAGDWDRAGRPGDGLYSGRRLAIAREWRAEHPDADWSGPAAELISASDLAETRAAARRSRIRRIAYAGTAAVVVVLAVVTGYALLQEAAADRERRSAQAGQFATASVAALDRDPELAVLFAAGAVERESSRSTRSALRRAIAASFIRDTLSGGGGSVRSVAFSPDGERVVSGSGDGTVRIWDANSTAEPLRLEGDGGFVYSVAFSPDGERVVSGSLDSTVRIWECDICIASADLLDAVPRVVSSGRTISDADRAAYGIEP